MMFLLLKHFELYARTAQMAQTDLVITTFLSTVAKTQQVERWLIWAQFEGTDPQGEQDVGAGGSRAAECTAGILHHLIPPQNRVDAQNSRPDLQQPSSSRQA